MAAVPALVEALRDPEGAGTVSHGIAIPREPETKRAEARDYVSRGYSSD